MSRSKDDFIVVGMQCAVYPLLNIMLLTPTYPLDYSGVKVFFYAAQLDKKLQRKRRGKRQYDRQIRAAARKQVLDAVEFVYGLGAKPARDIKVSTAIEVFTNLTTELEQLAHLGDDFRWQRGFITQADVERLGEIAVLDEELSQILLRDVSVGDIEECPSGRTLERADE